MSTTTYLWDTESDNLLSEDDGTSSMTYTNEPTHFGDLVSQNNSLTDNTNFYHFDARGDTRNLTNPAAVVTDSKTYDAWGRVVDSSGTSEMLFQFVGKLGYVVEPALDLNYVRARWYSPGNGNWMSADPLRRFVYSLATLTYQYSNNGVIGLVDPSGFAVNFPDAYTQELTAHVFDSPTTCDVDIHRPKRPPYLISPTSDTLSISDFGPSNQTGSATEAQTWSNIYVQGTTSWVSCCHEAPRKCTPRCPGNACCWECGTDGAKTIRAWFDKSQSWWTGPDSALVLRHERYHLKIAEVFACMLRKADPGVQIHAHCDKQSAINLGKNAWQTAFR